MAKTIVRQNLWLFVAVTLLALGLSCDEPVNNRLSRSLSPYLRAHADNPVDWYEWGEEALNRARNEDKPLLISIGYSSCHWCHRMEEESFMDTSVARLMNENFICIKVDREERPDIDNLYLHACQLLNNGQAGWPLNAFALPDGKPFFAGTYFSRNNWTNLLKQVADMYCHKRAKVNLQASAIAFGMADSDSLFLKPAVEKDLDQSLYRRFFESALAATDPVHAGISGPQKFPVPVLWDYFLQYHYFSKDSTALRTVIRALDKMACSGLYDVVGGGFFRYATDSLWMVPHFEKMLNDNAQLVSLYSNAYKHTKNEFYRLVAEETLQWIERELYAGKGGYFSSLAADSKEGEGAFYLLQKSESEKLIGNDKSVNDYFQFSNIVQNGAAKLLPFQQQSPFDFSKARQLSPEVFTARLSDVKLKLLEERSKKDKPTVDHKIIVSWNALMLLAFTDAYTAFAKPEYLQRALQLARFLEKNMMKPNGQLIRVASGSKISGNAFLDDYAYLAKAFIKLYAVGFDRHWLQQANKLTTYAVDAFYDDVSGNFYFSSAEAGHLAIRKVEWLNSVMPASNAVMGEVLLYLGVLLENNAYTEKSEKLFRNVALKMPEFSTSSPAWGMLAGWHLKPYREVAIAGSESLQINRQMQASYLPNCIFLGGSQENLPLLNGKMPEKGTLIYICTNRMCKMPVRTVEEAIQQLKEGK